MIEVFSANPHDCMEYLGKHTDLRVSPRLSLGGLSFLCHSNYLGQGMDYLPVENHILGELK